VGADVGFSASASSFFGPGGSLQYVQSIAIGRTYAPNEEPPAIATPPINNEPRINDRIRAREVRLVGPDGAQIGIKPLPEALSFARELDLDLVEVADKANPPVCRVMDYGKFKYEAAQKAKESRRKSTNVVIKEMKYRPKIGGGDFETKTKRVEKFLSEGHKVKVTIMFRGREVAHPELGKKILDRVAEEIAHTGRVEVYPKLDGPRNMIMVLAPDKKAQAAHAAERHSAEDAPAEGAASDEVPTEAAGAPAPAPDAEIDQQAEPDATEAPAPEPAPEAEAEA
jgi:translation initiation factor IF-3